MGGEMKLTLVWCEDWRDDGIDEGLWLSVLTDLMIGKLVMKFEVYLMTLWWLG